MKYRKIVLIALIMLSLYLLISFMPTTSSKVYAGQKPAGTLENDDIDGIDENFYPGYKQLLKNLKSAHPNYIFWLYYTGMNWNEVLTTEYQGHGGSPLNLFQIGDKYNGMWMCPLCGNKPYDNGSWCCASLEALSYMMDPRNSLNENDLFQFKLLTNGDVSYADISRVVSNYGTYLNNPEAIQAIVDASSMYQVNGYFLVSKIVNEHGKNGSTLSNGKGYNGNYVGCYNYFNVGSYGSGAANIINHGLSYAQSHGWTSIRASILGGAQIIKEKYITKYSQDTLYCQKFNVSGKSPLGSNQYQQNIMAAQSQGTSLKSYYTNLSAGNHIFVIPIYESMPKIPSGRPNAGQANTITWENATVQNINSSLRVRASANGTAIGALNNGESIKILKRASGQVGSYYWDLIVSNKDGTYGYAARGTSSETYLMGNSTTGSSSGTISNNPPPVEQAPTPPPTQEPEPEPLPKPEKPPKNLETDIKIEETSIQILPDINYEDLKTKYEEVTVKNSKDEEVKSGALGTGYKVTIKEQTYTVVKKGDVDGDSRITVADVRIMLNAISKNGPELKDIYKDAACVKGEENFTTGDIRYLLNCITGYAYISL